MNKFDIEYNKVMASFVKESPDHVWQQHPITGKELSLDYEDFDAFAFFDLDGYIIYSKRPTVPHFEALHNFFDDYAHNNKLAGSFPEMPNDVFEKLKIMERNGQINVHQSKIISFLGRYWVNEKVISFWQSKAKLAPRMNDIFNFLKFVNEDPTRYLYQFSNSEKLIPYNNLSDKLKTTISQAQIDALKAAHIQSPLLKQRSIPQYNMPLSTPGQPGKKWWAQASESVK